MFLRLRRSVVPSFSAVLRLEVEEKGDERTIVLIHSAAPSPVVVPDKESPHVPNNKRKSGCCRARRHPVRSCTILGHWQASKKDAACSSCCWWSITNVGKYQNGTSYTRVSARHNWDARAPLWVSFSKGLWAKNVLSPSGFSNFCGSWEQYLQLSMASVSLPFS